MLAYTAIIFAAVAAAFTANPHPEGVYKRSMLSQMTIGDSEEICAKDQKLVCCDHSKECGAIDVGGLNKSDQLAEHCTSSVVCCDFSQKNNIMWGDVTNNCIYAGQMS